jgi:hypothetical protein
MGVRGHGGCDDRGIGTTRFDGGRRLNRVPALLCVLVILLPLSGHCASDEAVQPSPLCPGADAWKEAHPEGSAQAIAQRDQARTFTDPDLRKQLQERFEVDQRARKEMIRAPGDRDVQRRVVSIDADNLAWLKKLAQDRGIPSAEQVGENGVKWAWALVQHADRDGVRSGHS